MLERAEYKNGPPSAEFVLALAQDRDHWKRQYADAQVIIADLQGQVEQLEETVIIRTREAQEEKRLHKEFADMYYQASERETALQQRVAQLERERDELRRDRFGIGTAWIGKDKYDKLQADHARVLGLVQAATKLLTELTIIPIGCSREQELAWKKAVKDLRAASLPAQPAACTRIGGCLKEQGFHCCCEDGTCD